MPGDEYEQAMRDLEDLIESDREEIATYEANCGMLEAEPPPGEVEFADLRKLDPVGWKRCIIRRSLTPREDPIEWLDPEAAASMPALPRWPHGLHGESTFLAGFEGVTIVNGGPSAGKTWLAAGSAVSAAAAGWHVIYLVCEMSPGSLARRAKSYLGHLPETFDLVEVDFGATIDSLISKVECRVTKRRTLVVFDSLSSFVDQAIEEDSGDTFRMGPIRRLVMWALSVKRATEGEVSFLLLSEQNASGGTKGRAPDHKADLVLSMSSDEKYPLMKHLKVIKAWEQRTGSLGVFELDPSCARLTRLGDD